MGKTNTNTSNQINAEKSKQCLRAAIKQESLSESNKGSDSETKRKQRVIAKASVLGCTLHLIWIHILMRVLMSLLF